MSYIPEDFHWDGVIFCLKCEISHLINTLMPLPIKKVEELTSKLQVFPTILAQNLSYKQRLDLEKKLEHLPLKIFWCPTGPNTQYHFQNATIKLNLEKSLLPFKAVEDSKRESFLLELNKFQNQYAISDFTLGFKEENYLQGLAQTIESQNIFDKTELLNFINIVKSNWEIIWRHTIDQSVTITPCHIAYFSSEKPIEMKIDEHVNLVKKNIFTEDFHLILPDLLVRGFYCKLIQSNNEDIPKRMDPELFQQNIFIMSELIYIVTNNWVKLKESSDIFIIKYDSKILNLNNENITIKNHSSGAGILLTWKLEMSGLPMHKFSMFFTLEAIQSFILP